jgi:hypothetical protein
VRVVVAVAAQRDAVRRIVGPPGGEGLEVMGLHVLSGAARAQRPPVRAFTCRRNFTIA